MDNISNNIDDVRGQLNYEYTTDTTKRIIKVIGVGGGGGNAVSTMYKKEMIKGVSFLLCNTDEQALNNSPVPNKITLGPSITKGLGAGNKPEMAKEAAEESTTEVLNALTSDDTEMVFITAGMGGGTGTGAAPIVGKIARDAGKLTVGIATIPFKFEGRRKILRALEGVRRLQESVDALLVVNNEKLIEIYGKKTVSEAFQLADNTLSNAARSISDIINTAGIVNMDFNDVKTTLKDSGVAVISSGMGKGNNRLKMALEEALTSPLLNNNDITKAKRLMIAIYYSEQDELLVEEISALNKFTDEIETDYDSKSGFYIDNELPEGHIRITILASGFGMEDTENSVFEVNSDISLRDNIVQRGEEDRRIEKYYGKGAILNGTRRRPLILKLSELDNEELLIIAEEKPALDRDLRLVESIRKRIDDSESYEHHTTEPEIISEETPSNIVEETKSDDSKTIYF
jgi:cell division protein ftsZ